MISDTDKGLFISGINAPTIKRGGVSIIWIEHVVHALLVSIDRLLVMHNGAFIAEGDPHTVIKSPAVSEIYMGMETDV